MAEYLTRYRLILGSMSTTLHSSLYALSHLHVLDFLFLLFARYECWSASICCAKAWTIRMFVRGHLDATPQESFSPFADVPLIQPIGRVARNLNGEAILYADKDDPL